MPLTAIIPLYLRRESRKLMRGESNRRSEAYVSGFNSASVAKIHAVFRIHLPLWHILSLHRGSSLILLLFIQFRC